MIKRDGVAPLARVPGAAVERRMPREAHWAAVCGPRTRLRYLEIGGGRHELPDGPHRASVGLNHDRTLSRFAQECLQDVWLGRREVVGGGADVPDAVELTTGHEGGYSFLGVQRCHVCRPGHTCFLDQVDGRSTLALSRFDLH